MGISLSGLGSGFDWQSVVDQLRQVENRKITSLNTQKTQYDSKLSAWKSLSTKLDAFKTVAQGLKDQDDFDLFKTTLTSSSSVSVDSLLSVTAGSGAAKGRYDIVVSKMARAEKLQSAALYDDASTALNKVGTLTINGKELSLDGTESLSTLRDRINALDAGAVASVLHGADGKYRLILTSETEGASGISLEDLSGPDMIFSITALQEGVDAEFTVDGIAMKSSSNVVTDAIPGLTLSLTGESPTTTISLSVDRDNEAVKGKIQKLVDAYNDLASFFGQQTSYDSANKKTGGPLFGDTTLKSVKSALQSIWTQAQLGARGVSTGKDNKLTLDADKLASALNTDFNGTLGAFNSVSETIEMTVNKFTDYVNGGVTVQQNTIQTAMKNLDKRIATTQEFIDRKMEMLTNQFISLDGALAQMQNTSSWLSTQLSSLASWQK
jgi:flagellar hook-associated protein 2